MTPATSSRCILRRTRYTTENDLYSSGHRILPGSRDSSWLQGPAILTTMASAATEVMAEFNPANTSGSSNSLFSKFARSPSRKHKPRPSSESIDPVSVAAAKASKAKARPGLQRGTTAPDGISTVSNASRGEPISRKISNGSSSLVPPSEKSATMYAVPALSAGELSQDTHYRFVRSDVPKVPPIHGGLAYNPTLAVADSGLSNPNTLYQNIYNHSTKRMATLDYMRKA